MIHLKTTAWTSGLSNALKVMELLAYSIALISGVNLFFSRGFMVVFNIFFLIFGAIVIISKNKAKKEVEDRK